MYHDGSRNMKTKTTLLPYELDAIQAWATLHGRCWKNALREAWYSGNYHGFADYGTLQSIRNNPAYGPEWLNAFSTSHLRWPANVAGRDGSIAVPRMHLFWLPAF